jgi:hypothetical protein
MFPVDGSLAQGAPPSLAWVPAVPVPHGQRYYEGTATSGARIPDPLWFPFRVPHASPSFVLAEALPERRRTTLVSRSPSVRRLACGYALDLSGFLAIHPTPLPCSETPAGPTRPRHWRSCRCCPRSQHAEGSSRNMISRLTQGFDVPCLRFTSGVAAAHARLVSGWRAAPLPGGS